MASAARFGIYTCTLNATDLTQMESWSASTNVQKSTTIVGGLIDASFHGVASASPTITAGTRDLVTFWGAVDAATGLNLSSGATFRFQERTDGGTFETGSTHETVSITEGFCRPTTLSADQGSDDGARLEFEVVPTWDGTNDPLVHNQGVSYAMTPSTPAFVSRFFLGPVYVNSAEVPGITNVSIDFGINYEAKAFSGDPYAKAGAIITRTPVITFTTAKVDEAGDLASLFAEALPGTCAIYFQKGVTSGTRVAAASAVHCKITATAGDWQVDDEGVQGNDDGTASISVRPTVALAAVTNSAIP